MTTVANKKFNENDEYLRKKEREEALLRKCKIIPCFEVEGTIYVGNLHTAIATFLHNNPRDKADFSVWLDNNYQILIRLK